MENNKFDLIKPFIDHSVCGVYCIINIVNGKKYIGKSKNIYKRIHQHKYDILNDRYRNENAYFRASVKKYGINCFRYFIVEECTLSDVSDKELYWIDFYETTNRDLGYNLRRDSSTGMIAHESTIHKISERLKREWSDGVRKGHGRKLKESWSKDENRKVDQSKLMTKLKTKYSYKIIGLDTNIEEGTYKDLKILGLKNCMATFQRSNKNTITFKGYIITRILK